MLVSIVFVKVFLWKKRHRSVTRSEPTLEGAANVFNNDAYRDVANNEDLRIVRYGQFENED